MIPEVKVSVIVTTYNWPQALESVINALAQQSISPFEVIIADDGSLTATTALIQAMKEKYPLNIKHVWQVDEGFQAAKIRNKAAAQAQGDYLIFLDGDCIPLKHFILRQQKLAIPQHFVAGNRILLSQQFSSYVLENNLNLLDLSLIKWCTHWKNGDCNRLVPLLFLPFPRTLRPHNWKNAKTCNLALWKDDFIDVNGFDENYQGWGYEDSDLVIRLLKNGIKRKDGRFALSVIHLWHQEQDRSLETKNLQRLSERLADEIIEAPLGVKQYLGLGE